MALALRRILPRNSYNTLQDYYFLVRSLHYLGNKKQCPCCGWHLRRFIARKDTLATRTLPACPRCHAIERHRWLWLYLKEHTDILTAPTRLLHFAPEFCFYRLYKHLPNVYAVRVDLVDNGRTNLRQDITQLAFDDATFDAIICNHVLEHVPDDRRAMSELYRVLKPGGWAVISVPVRLDQPTYEDPAITLPAEREQHFGQADHVRWYGNDLPDRLRSAGFAVQVERTRDLPPEVIDRYGLAANGVMFFCTRPELN